MYCLQLAFIKQEALEKAREIKVKADEEFAIEKVRSPDPLGRHGEGLQEGHQLKHAFMLCRPSS